MGDLNEMFLALQKADAAGNFDDARRIAEMIRQQRVAPTTPEFKPIPAEPGFFKAWGTGALSTLGSLAPALGLMWSPDDQEAAERLRKNKEEAEQAYQRTEFSEIGERAKAGDIGGALGATWSKFKELAGESLGFQTPAAAVGLGARVAAGALAGAPAGPVGAAVGAGTGALWGLGAYGVTLLGQYIAGNLERQVEENKGKPVDRLSATVAAAGQAGLDMVGLKFLGLNKLLGLEGRKAAEQTVAELVKAAEKGGLRETGKAAGIGVLKGTAFEVPQEVAQTVLERWQAGLETDPFKDPKAAADYAHSAAAALMLGGPAGAIGRVGAGMRTRAEAREELGRRAAEEEEATLKQLQPQMSLPFDEQPVDRRAAIADIQSQSGQYAEALAALRGTQRIQNSYPEDSPERAQFDDLIADQQAEVDKLYTALPKDDIRRDKQTDLTTTPPIAAAAPTQKVTYNTLRGLEFKFGAKTKDIAKQLTSLDVATPDGLTKFQALVDQFEEASTAVTPYNAEKVAEFIGQAKFRLAKQAEFDQDMFGGQWGGPPPIEYGERRAGPAAPSLIEDQPQFDFDATFPGIPLLRPTHIPTPKIQPALEPGAEPQFVTETAFGNMGIGERVKADTQLRSDLSALDLNRTEDAGKAKQLLLAYRDRGTTSATKKAAIDNYIRGVGLTEQTGFDFTAPQEVPDAGRPGTDRKGDVVPVPPATTGRRKAAGMGRAAVVGGKRPAGVPAERTTREPTTLEKKKPAGINEYTAAEKRVQAQARGTLQKMGFDKTAIDDMLAANTENGVLDIDGVIEAVENSAGLKLETKPVGNLLNDTASKAVQAGDLRGALRAISETSSTPWMRIVAQKLLAYVGNTRVKIGETVDGAAGHYDPETDTITINPNSLYEHTLLHEMVHAAVSHVLRNRFHPLTQQLAGLYMKVLPRIQSTYGATSLQEFAAEAQSNPEFRAMLKAIPYPQGALKTVWDHVVNAVRKFLGLSPRQSRSALDKIDEAIDKLLTTAEFEPRTPGDILLLNANVSGAAEAYQQVLNNIGAQSRALPEFTQGWFNAVGKLGRGLTSAITKTLDLNHLVEIYGARVPALRMIVDQLNEKHGFVNTNMADANRNHKLLQRLHDKYKASGEFDKFAGVSFDSTRHRYDPSDVANSGDPNAPEGKLIQARYNQLPDDLRKAYVLIKNHYKALYQHYMAALRKDLEGVPEADQAKILADIESRIKPYFPLMRFGDYWMEFEQNGERIITAFETPEDRHQAIADMKLNTSAPGFRIYKKFEEVTARPPSDPMIKRTLKTMRDAGIADATVEKVHRELLRLNPQQSAILNTLKRQGYKGFSTDLVRSYATMAPRLIMQTASRMYNNQILETAGYARVQLQNISNDPKLSPKGYDAMADAVADQLSGEKGSRLDNILNPKMSTIASFMNWMTYGYFMGANVSTAIIELTQTPMIAYPLMAGRFGPVDAAKALADAYKFYGSHAFKNPIENLKTHGYISPSNTIPKNHPLAHLYSELHRRGQINTSVSHEILGLQAKPTDSNSRIKQAVGKAMSFSHHTAGMSNREITAIAAYNLAKKNNMTEAKAVDYAIDVVTKSHGSASLDTAGPLFQNSVGRVVLMFKRFSQLMVFRAARTMYVAIKGDTSLDGPERVQAMKIAQKQLLGIYLMAFAFSGAQGLPLYGVVEMLYNIFQSVFGDDMEYKDFENMVRDSLHEMAYKGAVNYATGRDIAQRTGFGDLLIRDDSLSKAELGPLMFYFQQYFGGAFLGAVNNMNRGYKLIQGGHLDRGLETMMPAAVRNVWKGARFMAEGATTVKGDHITDDLGAHDALFQMAGFAPTKLTDIYAKRGFMKDYQKFVLQRRTSLLDQYEMAHDSGDSDALSNVRDNIARFNSTYPEKRIDSQTIQTSMQKRTRREKEAVYGVQLDKNLRARLLREVSGGDD